LQVFGTGIGYNFTDSGRREQGVQCLGGAG
jgi:hypothetical protein